MDADIGSRDSIQDWDSSPVRRRGGQSRAGLVVVVVVDAGAMVVVVSGIEPRVTVVAGSARRDVHPAAASTTAIVAKRSWGTRFDTPKGYRLFPF